jgi:hypothetical protein
MQAHILDTSTAAFPPHSVHVRLDPPLSQWGQTHEYVCVMPHGPEFGAASSTYVLPADENAHPVGTMVVALAQFPFMPIEDALSELGYTLTTPDAEEAQ